MSPAGLEPTTYGLKVLEGRNRSSISEKAQCADPQLVRFINDWPHYSAAKRAAILALAETRTL